MPRLVVLALFLLVPINASAFLLYTTEDGKYVRWHREAIEIILDESLDNLGPRYTVDSVILQSFDLWLDNTDIPLVFSFRHDRCDPFVSSNQNCIMACNDKARCYDRDEDKGATTFVHYLPSDGRITGASIVYNAADWRWIATDVPTADISETADSNEEMHQCASDSSNAALRKPALNLNRVTTHEIGHLLGIDHSDYPEAIMYYAMNLEDASVSELHPDDIEAASVLYGGYPEEIVADAEAYSGCLSVAAGRSPAGSLFSVIVLLLSVWMISYRARRGNR
jgi:hypothetical protein